MTNSLTNEKAKAVALRFVILLSLISLCSDIVYEGARSISGPFLGELGASAFVVATVAGLGELLGYALRLVSGRVADRTKSYWLLTIVGYFINLLAVPLLAFANGWQIAAGLLVVERAGKAIRTPARDVMLSSAGDRLGPGFAFGLHGALDQVGAVLGPLIMAWAVAAHQGLRAGFIYLAIPAVVALLLLLAARAVYPRPGELSINTPALSAEQLNKVFWWYLAAACLVGAGYVDFPLLAFHLQKSEILQAAMIAACYSAAMASEALSGLLFGRLFDRYGLLVLAGATLIAAGATPLVLLGTAPAYVWAGVSLWGVGMGAQDAVMRATIAKLVPPERRGSAYGLFGLSYGLAWFSGSALLGFLYGHSIVAVAAVSAGLQLLAVPIFLSVGAMKRR